MSSRALCLIIVASSSPLGLRGEDCNLWTRTIELPASPVPLAVSIDDLNADGLPDLITEDHREVATLLQRPGLRFEPPRTYPFERGFSHYAYPWRPVVVADLTGDGTPELAATAGEGDRAGTVRVLRNRGDGSFEQSEPLVTGVGSPAHLTAADLDADGAAELVTAHMGDCDLERGRLGGADVSVLRNLGDGAFSEAVSYDSGSVPDRPAHWVAAEDFDLDGALDIALVLLSGMTALGTDSSGDRCFYEVKLDGRVAVFRNRGDGTLLPATLHVVGEALRMVVADLNADGRPDIALPELSRTVGVLLNDPVTGFPERAAWHGVGGTPQWLIAADLDGDGPMDLAATHYSSDDSYISVLYGKGGGLFEAEVRIEHGGYSQELIAGDLDGNGMNDLATHVKRWDGNVNGGQWVFSAVAALLNEGGRAFDTQRYYPVPASNLNPVAAADLDNDGRVDLVTAWDGFDPTLGVYDPHVAVLLSAPAAIDADRDQNGIPDDCEMLPRPRSLFHRGDPNGDGKTDIADAVFVLGFLFLGDAALPCLESADSQNDGRVDISDPLSLLGFLFLGSEPPAPPWALEGACGEDPDPPGSAGDLGCTAYAHCGGGE